MTAPIVPVLIMGKRYDIPLGLTILKAYEYAGYHLVRGVGCRGGLCGACATIYRNGGDHHRRACLACQTAVQAGMVLAPIAFYPAHRPAYELAELKDPGRAVVEIYPELRTCLGCNACAKICPQAIDVMAYVAAILRGDLEKAADLSFDCVMCGLCATACPAEISQYNAALLARRVFARYLVTGSFNVPRRTAEIRSGQYDGELHRLLRADDSELKTLYAARDFKNK